MELRDALDQITEIRQQMARTVVFRGYRAAPAVVSAAIAVGAALVQQRIVPEPGEQVHRYLALWCGVAVLCLVLFAVEMGWRYRRSGTLHRETTLLAVEQFLPCLVAGAAVTVVIYMKARGAAWVLPGVWQVLFAMGVFASRRLLPGAVFFVGAFYLLCGIAVLGLAHGEFAYSPWAMGFPFGMGQLLVAGVLYWNLERRGDGQEQD